MEAEMKRLVCVVAAGLAVALSIVLAVVLTTVPAFACNPQITMSQVDNALSSAGIKGSQLADANALRDYMAEAVQRNDQRRAHQLETQVMALMGYVEDRPVSRSGGCARVWTRKQ